MSGFEFRVSRFEFINSNGPETQNSKLETQNSKLVCIDSGRDRRYYREHLWRQGCMSPGSAQYYPL